MAKVQEAPSRKPVNAEVLVELRDDDDVMVAGGLRKELFILLLLLCQSSKAISRPPREDGIYQSFD
jgi:hypothetical protein